MKTVVHIYQILKEHVRGYVPMLAIVESDLLETVFGPAPRIMDLVHLFLGIDNFSSLEEKVAELDRESAVLTVTYGKPSKDDRF